MKIWKILFMLVISMFIYVLPANAHADLSSSNPANGDILESVPEEVRLTFTTEIDPTVFELDVRNEEGKSVAIGEPVILESKNELTIDVAPEAKGPLQVVYSVISKDGHPIKGVIPFSVNKKEIAVSTIKPNVEEMKLISISSKVSTTKERSAKSDSSEMDQMGVRVSPLNSVIKFLYMTSLLVLTGLLMWKSQGIRTRFIPASQLIHFVLLFLFTWSQARGFLAVFDHLTWGDLFLRTEVGQYWTAAFVVTVLGLYMIGRNRWIDLSFVVALFLLKSLNSHAVASEFPMVTVGLNFIHLGLAALWVGGLFILVTTWQKTKTKAFLPVFSRVALLSLLGLTVTGTIYAFILAPSIDALWTTTWGLWLSAKIISVFGVFIVGGLIRRKMKMQVDFSQKNLLYVDSGLVVVILFIVGVLTQLSPS